jgi:hypothetical protein
MDLTWPLFIVIIIGVGIYNKRRNTIHIRKMVKELKEKS